MEDPQDRGESEIAEGDLSDAPVPTDAPPVPAARRFPSSNIGRPRIEGVEAGVAAGLVPPTTPATEGRDAPGGTPRHLSRHEPLYEEPVPDEIAAGIELPDWTDPPTREVPRVLLQQGEASRAAIPGPVWRESQGDFDQDQEAFAEIVSESVPVVAHDEGADADDDFGFENFDRFDGIDEASPPDHPARWSAPEETTVYRVIATSGNEGLHLPAEQAGDAGVGRVRFAGRAVTAKPPEELPEPLEEVPPARPRGRNPVIATSTGLLVGGVALLCFFAGPIPALVISSLVLLLAAAEFFQTLRRVRYQPATLLGLVAAPGFAIAAYVKGPEAIPVLAAIGTVATICWYLVGVTRKAVVANISVSLLGIFWIAGLGCFAGLLLDPTAFPLRHGVAYLLGAAEVTVAYDVGGYAFGSWLGQHKLVPSISPNKTWEGLIGGSLSALVIALAVTSQMHPWDLKRAAALGIVVAIVAPVGDLAESMIKRDLKVKDMGTLLPAHGGVLDRVDALLFVLPATYFLVRLFHG
ncbi:MAG: phosphatidate cytidylyltransferase [Acidimicrobiales bacterium]|jgi:phosphatidate cytidylyltransferase